MVDISSILNKYRNEKKKEPPSSQSGDKEKNKYSNLEDAIASATNTEFEKNKGIEAINTYNEITDIIKSVYAPSPDLRFFLSKNCDAALKKIIDLVQAGDNNLLRISLNDYPGTEPYLGYHAVNVCILAITLGIALKFDFSGLLEIGKGSLLHDIGLVNYFNLITKPEILSNTERKLVKNHPSIGSELIRSLAPQSSPNVILVAQQEHERIDGSGYPAGLKDHAIEENSQLVGLCDVYESMTHRRPYRDKFSPLETMKYILSQKSAFATKFTKILVQRIGIYPIGTAVRLSNREVGIVTGVNPDSPFCPMVNIVFDSDAKELSQQKNVDLSSHKMLTIEDCIKT